MRGKDTRIISGAILALAVTYGLWFTQIYEDRFFIDSPESYFRWVYYGAVMLMGGLTAITRVEAFVLWRSGWSIIPWSILYAGLLLALGTVAVRTARLKLEGRTSRPAAAQSIEQLRRGELKSHT